MVNWLPCSNSPVVGEEARSIKEMLNFFFFFFFGTYRVHPGSKYSEGTIFFFFTPFPFSFFLSGLRFWGLTAGRMVK